MVLAEVELIPFWFVVEAASLTVTFWPADVVIVKPDVDTLSTVPDAPPEAGPDRALDPSPPAVGEGDVADAEGDVDVAEGDVAQPAESPVIAHVSAAAAIHPPFLFDSNRRTPGERACLATITETDKSGDVAGREGGAPRRTAWRTAGAT